MKVAFTYYPLNIPWNHGAAVLVHLCKDAGIDAEMFPLYEGFTGEGYDSVCVSYVTIHDYQASLRLVREIQTPKFAGGVYARKGGVLDGFDYVCRGEGERIVDFFLKGDTAVFDSALIDENINTLPDYSQVTGYEFGRGIPFLKDKRMIPYGHSRGCKHNCSFCEVRNLPRALRIKTSVRDDLEILRTRFDPDLFYFMDETLPYYSGGWREQFVGNDTPFLCFLRGDIEPSELEFLINNGMHSCAIGVESGDEEYRNGVLNKGVTDAQLFRTAEKLDKRGVNRIMLYMRNTPGETDHMKSQTFDMIEKLGGHALLFEYEEL